MFHPFSALFAAPYSLAVAVSAAAGRCRESPCRPCIAGRLCRPAAAYRPAIRSSPIRPAACLYDNTNTSRQSSFLLFNPCFQPPFPIGLQCVKPTLQHSRLLRRQLVVTAICLRREPLAGIAMGPADGLGMHPAIHIAMALGAADRAAHRRSVLHRGYTNSSSRFNSFFAAPLYFSRLTSSSMDATSARILLKDS